MFSDSFAGGTFYHEVQKKRWAEVATLGMEHATNHYYVFPDNKFPINAFVDGVKISGVHPGQCFAAF